MKLVAAKCPSCGANIEVDPNSDRTKCEYCKTKIIVDDAIAKFKIEISGEVEVKNIPKLESYMKNAARNYNNGNYNDAYNYYNKALELDPENTIALLRVGICRTIINDIDSYEYIFEGIKDSYKLFDDNTSKDDYYWFFEEVYKSALIYELMLKNYYEKKLCVKEDMEDLLRKHYKCLELYGEAERVSLNIQKKYKDNGPYIRVLKAKITLIGLMLKGKKYRSKKDLNKYEVIAFIPPRVEAEKLYLNRNELIEKYNKLVDEKDKMELQSIPFIRTNGSYGQLIKYIIIGLIVFFIILALVRYNASIE